MANKKQPEFQFDLTGGNPSLDLANSVSHRDDPERRREHLASYSDLLAFARQSGILSSKQLNDLRSYAQQHPAQAGESFANTIALREALYRTFAAIAQGKAVVPGDLGLINDVAVEALQHRVLSWAGSGYRWEWAGSETNPLDRIRLAAAHAAAELLTSDELKMVRFCEAPDCEWLFLDHSRNRSRRWCDMTSCGNRQKARRHYQRAHHASS